MTVEQAKRIVAIVNQPVGVMDNGTVVRVEEMTDEQTIEWATALMKTANELDSTQC